ncbi:MAG: hypothetical protein DHS20C18_39380 [Saprospiraceae bacterium]|nr:MAG: hypothetical protein DHS20C18_39380 [Saprospiraceae bacterium]
MQSRLPNIRSINWFIASLLLFGNACTQNSGTKAIDGNSTQGQVIDLPQTKEQTITIEGYEQQIKTKLFQSPEDYPLSFHTYIPEDFTEGREKSGEGDILIFSRGKAQLKLMVFSKLVNYKMAEGLAQSMVSSKGELGIDRIKGRTIYSLQGDAPNALQVEAGQRNGHAYLWVREFPLEYGDGFGPTANLIMSNVEWASKK